MLGGNHWREAVQIHVDWSDTQVCAEDKKLRIKESKGADGGMPK